jgi:hypothetical protein
MIEIIGIIVIIGLIISFPLPMIGLLFFLIILDGINNG